MRMSFVAAAAAVALSACTSQQSPECAEYVACAQAMDEMLGQDTSAVWSQYEPGTDCWSDPVQSAACTAGCIAALEVADDEPGAPEECGGDGSGIFPPDAGFETDAGFAPDSGFEIDAGFTPDAGFDADAGDDVDGGEDAGVTDDAGADDDAGTDADAGPDVDAGAQGDAGQPVSVRGNIWSVVGSSLFHFDASSCASPLSTSTITGMDGYRVAGLDVRHTTGDMYALAVPQAGIVGPDQPPPPTDVRLYVLDTDTGAATYVGGYEPDPAQTTNIAFEIDDVLGEARVLSTGNTDVRISLLDGSVIETLPAPAYLVDDANAGAVPWPTAASFGADGTPLYVIDGTTQSLATLGATGLTTVGPLGVTIDKDNSFDVASTGVAFAILSAGASALYTIDLATGTASFVCAAPGVGSTIAMTTTD